MCKIGARHTNIWKSKHDTVEVCVRVSWSWRCGREGVKCKLQGHVTWQNLWTRTPETLPQLFFSKAKENWDQKIVGKYKKCTPGIPLTLKIMYTQALRSRSRTTCDTMPTKKIFIALVASRKTWVNQRAFAKNTGANHRHNRHQTMQMQFSHCRDFVIWNEAREHEKEWYMQNTSSDRFFVPKTKTS